MDRTRLIRLWLGVWIAAMAAPGARAIGPEEIPVAAPLDAVMTGAEEIRQMQTWASRSFGGAWSAGTSVAVGVEVRRQDHSVLRFGESCIDTPIRLGNREFARGLGTHANSEIVLHLPGQAKEFRAWVGIDNNPNTGGYPWFGSVLD